MLAIILILTDFLSPEYLPILVKEVSFIKGPPLKQFITKVTEASTLPLFKNFY